ncbi:LOW QUALITY PROTEIN: hypothetical protein ACHAXT_011713 [Thalassiosira profunda]
MASCTAQLLASEDWAFAECVATLRDWPGGMPTDRAHADEAARIWAIFDLDCKCSMTLPSSVPPRARMAAGTRSDASAMAWSKYPKRARVSMVPFDDDSRMLLTLSGAYSSREMRQCPGGPALEVVLRVQAGLAGGGIAPLAQKEVPARRVFDLADGMGARLSGGADGVHDLFGRCRRQGAPQVGR